MRHKKTNKNSAADTGGVFETLAGREQTASPYQPVHAEDDFELTEDERNYLEEYKERNGPVSKLLTFLIFVFVLVILYQLFNIIVHFLS